MSRAELRFWGVRGSMAVSGPRMISGGDTACLEIRFGQTLLICDAGTGIRRLGLQLMKHQSIHHMMLLFSHLHLDHFIGLPFFQPLYDRRCHIVIAGPKCGKKSFRASLAVVTSPPYFPIPLSNVLAKLTYRSLGTSPFRVGAIRVVPFALNHPGGALGWRFEFPHGKTIVHVTDNEPQSAAQTKRLLLWMKHADLLIHDAQYTPAEYQEKKGWGHSPYTFPLQLAAEARIQHVILFHHDPVHDDATLNTILSQARQYVRRQKWDIRCDLARVGATLSL